MLVCKFILYCTSHQIAFCKLISRGPLALHGTWVNKVNECDNERLLSISKAFT